MSERQNQSFYSAYGNITVLDVVTICSAAKLPRKKGHKSHYNKNIFLVHIPCSEGKNKF